MKKLFLLLGLTTLFSLNTVHAQEHDVEVGLAYGAVSAQAFITGFGNALGSAIASGIAGDSLEKSESKGSGALTGKVEFFVSERFSAGAAYTFESFTTTNTYARAGELSGKDTFHVPQASATFRYVNKENFRFYSNIGAGYYFSTSKSDSSSDTRQNNNFALQFSPLGVQFGKEIAVKLELGIGFQGTMIGGVNGKF